MALTAKQTVIIERYIQKYIWDISTGDKNGLTSEDLYDFVLKAKADQMTEIKAWAIPVLQAEKSVLQAKQSALPAEITDIDDTITEVNDL
jgi:hypothetical protein